MIAIPLQPVPSQVVRIVLGGQNCTLKLYQKTTGFYCDLMIDATVIWSCAICQDNNPICSYGYLPFVGVLTFYDTIANTNPQYQGLGAQYQLFYLAPGEGAA